MIGNLMRPDGVLAPKREGEWAGIGTRVRMVFTDVAPGPPAARRGDTGGRERSPFRGRQSLTNSILDLS